MLLQETTFYPGPERSKGFGKAETLRTVGKQRAKRGGSLNLKPKPAYTRGPTVLVRVPLKPEFVRWRIN